MLWQVQKCGISDLERYGLEFSGGVPPSTPGRGTTLSPTSPGQKSWASGEERDTYWQAAIFKVILSVIHYIHSS